MARNLLLNTSFEKDSDADGFADIWTKSSTVVGTPVFSLVSPGLNGSVAQRWTYTGVAGDTGKLLGIQQDSAVGSFVAGADACLSIFQQAVLVGCNLQLVIEARNAAGGYIAEAGNYVVTVTPAFAVRSYVFTPLPANTVFCRAFIRVNNIHEGDTLDITIDCVKLERAAAPSVWNQNNLPTLQAVGVI